ncbi:MAG: DUF1569 domain-containing protein [Bacteroidota bacterium]
MKKRIGILLITGIILFLSVLKQNSIWKDDFLEPELKELQGYIEYRDNLNPLVSEVPVAWHLDHSLKVINNICDTLNTSNPETYKHTFNGGRLFCFTLGYIPRGAGQSPKSAHPPATIHTEDLHSQLRTARMKLRSIAVLDERTNFKHPYFNILNKGQSKRFIKIHTEHHLKIIKDILGE